MECCSSGSTDSGFRRLQSEVGENLKKLYLPLLIVLILCLVLPLHPSAASPAQSETNLLAVSGNTLFAYFNSGSRHLSRSENEGLTWSSKNIGAGLNGSSVVALEMSPDYGTDRTLYAATSTSLYKSVEGGDNFTRILQLADYQIAGNITSLDIGPAGRILIGTGTGLSGGSIDLYDNSTWTNLEIGQKDVFGVAFSPNYLDDAQILAFTYDGSLAQIETRVNSATWNDFFPAAQLYSEEGVIFQSAVIKFPGNYEYIETNGVFAGINATGNGADVYRVRFSPKSTPPAITDLNLNGPDTSTRVHSISLTGTLGGGSLAVGQADSNIVKRTSGLLESAPTWLDSSIPPDGSANVGLKYAHPVDGPFYQKVFAITTGTGAGIFESDDDGDTFSHIPPLQIDDLAVVDSTVDTISLTWTSPADADNDSVFYRLGYLEGTEITPDNWDTVIQAPGSPIAKPAGSTETFTVEFLKPNTTYYFAVEANEIEGERYGLSNSPSGRTKPVSDIDPPLAVTDLRAVKSTTNSITLKWTAPGDIVPQYYGESSFIPPDGAINMPPEVVFRWPWEESADVYQFQLSDNVSFSELIDNQTDIPENSWAEPLKLTWGTTYYWRERVQYQEGPAGGWETASFTVMAEPAAHTEYDIRYSLTSINSESWSDASQVSGEPVPLNPGENETYTVKGLKSDKTYYFALKTKDAASNWSDMSNVCSGKTGKGGYIFHVDVTPPAKITDLKVIENNTGSITLQWTAPGDDGNEGNASNYDLRYMEKTSITKINWDSTVSVAGVPPPKPSGTTETFKVSGLKADTIYYFGIKTADEVPNWSDLSNIAAGNTIVVAPVPTPTPKPTSTSTPTPSPSPVSKPPDNTTSGSLTEGGPLFTINGLTVSKAKITAGEKIEAIAAIANIGSKPGDFTAQLMVNGKVVDTVTVAGVAPASQKPAIFVFSSDTAADYNLQVGDKTATVTVIEVQKQQGNSGIVWWIILIALIFLVAIILTLRKVLHWGFKK
jgi:hypothetical protein